jgi:hypothetical protein
VSRREELGIPLAQVTRVRCARVVYVALAMVAASACAATIRSTAKTPIGPEQLAELWAPPRDIRAQDLYNGPWGREFAPDANAEYTFVKEKTHGVSPGMTVRDPRGVEWNVKQGAEARIEVVASRILSAAGYHQPPVYYLPQWRLRNGPTPGIQAEGRFRPKLKQLRNRGEWSWQRNPFVGTQPYRGLLVILEILNSSDLKNSNNSLYEVRGRGSTGPRVWYVVRDLGTALGETGRLDPKRGDPDLFERHPFIDGVGDGFVRLDYHGRHQELFDHTIRPADVRWACSLLAKLTDEQWRDAFRASGYGDDLASRFIRRIQEKIRIGLSLRDDGSFTTASAR